MIIQVQDLLKIKGSTLDLDFEEKLADIELRQEIYKFHHPVHFKGSLTNTEKVLNLSGTLETEFSTVCANCCEPVKVKQKLPIQETFVGTGSNEDLENEAEDGDADLYRYTGSSIDTTDVFRDNILLNIPIKIVCSPDCKGLCPDCGINLNKESCTCSRETINPMMEKLKDFFKE